MKLFLLFAFLPILSAPLRASHPEDSVTTVSLHAIPGLQYDLVQFKVKPGARVKVVFTNKDDMSHYPYVCTFPGHGFVMYGVMYVTTDEHLPDLENDLNIPPTRRQDNAAESVEKNKDHALYSAKTESPHPYEPTPPYLYRVYMEDASPAAIAVNLPHELSYCWDAGTCQLRYAWQGGFVDNAAVWKGKPNAVAKILGTIFFHEMTTHPLRIGRPDEIPLTAYKGYQLINRYPEFHYTLNGIDVYELIHSKADGTGLVRTFRIPKAGKSVWLYVHPEDGVEYESRHGKWEKNR